MTDQPHTFIVPESHDRMRLRECASELLNHLPTKHIRKLIRKGYITLDGKNVRSNTLVTPGQQINYMPMPYPHKAVHIDMQVSLEDDHLAVINKPAGILVSGNVRRTIENALRNTLNASGEDDALPIFRPVHRLDKDTSGALIIAKTTRAVRSLSEQFATHNVGKFYTALVSGVIAATGIIDTPIGKRHAVTEFRRRESFVGEGWSYSLVAIKILTGRTHQIRKHFSGIGHSVCGDDLYGKGQERFRRLMLHASEVVFQHPVDQTECRVTVPLPGSFTSGLPGGDYSETSSPSSGM